MDRTETLRMPAMPISQIVYGEIVYWVTIAAALICTVGPTLALIFMDHNVMDPSFTFGAIFAGKKAADVWALSQAGGFPGGHFYVSNLFTGDGFTQLGLALGCGVALPGLLGATIAFAKSKSWGFVALSLWVGFLIFFSAAGIVSMH